LSKSEAGEISELFIKHFPMTSWGKIDWEKIGHKIAIGNSPNKIIPTLEKLLQKSFDKNVYIDWSEGTDDISVIKTNLDLVVKYFDDVTCVACDKFIFNLDTSYVIEILHLGNITIGITPPTE
jgi:hypothetical protein